MLWIYRISIPRNLVEPSFYLSVFQWWQFSSCGGQSQLNECWTWSKHYKHVRSQACIGRSPCTMVHLCMWMCTCAVLLIFASCARQPPWPLTTVLEPVLAAYWRTGGPGGLKELGPLSMITLIKPALCNDWLAPGFISPTLLCAYRSLYEREVVAQGIRRRGGGLVFLLVDRLTSPSFQMILQDENAAGG